MKTVHCFYAGCAALVVVIYWATNTWPASIVIEGLTTIFSYVSSKGEDWIREWLGATSGWAAFFAAVVTTVILVRQLAEQRRQTAFILGDAPPTVDCLQDVDDPTQIIIRLVNWNRRTILLHALGSENFNVKNRKFDIVEIKKNDVVVRNHSGHPYLEGWEDRAKAPNNMKLKLVITRNGEPISDFPSTMVLKIMIRLLGQNHDMVELRCGLHPNA